MLYGTKCTSAFLFIYITLLCVVERGSFEVLPEIIGSLFVFIIINLHFELSLEIFVSSSACGLKLTKCSLLLENAKERLKIENFQEGIKRATHKNKRKYSSKILNARTNKTTTRRRSYYIIAFQIIVACNPFGCFKISLSHMHKLLFISNFIVQQISFKLFGF